MDNGTAFFAGFFLLVGFVAAIFGAFAIIAILLKWLGDLIGWIGKILGKD